MSSEGAAWNKKSSGTPTGSLLSMATAVELDGPSLRLCFKSNQRKRALHLVTFDKLVFKKLMSVAPATKLYLQLFSEEVLSKGTLSSSKQCVFVALFVFSASIYVQTPLLISIVLSPEPP